MHAWWSACTFFKTYYRFQFVGYVVGARCLGLFKSPILIHSIFVYSDAWSGWCIRKLWIPVKNYCKKLSMLHSLRAITFFTIKRSFNKCLIKCIKVKGKISLLIQMVHTGKHKKVTFWRNSNSVGGTPYLSHKNWNQIWVFHVKKPQDTQIYCHIRNSYSYWNKWLMFF